MNYLYSAIFGLTQGIAEFLPISSSGHLVILHELVNFPVGDSLAFDVFLHLATLLAVVYFFSADIKRLFFAWLKSLAGKTDADGRLAWLILVGVLPAAAIGCLFEDFVSGALRSSAVVAVMLVAVGVLFLLAERLAARTLEMKNLKLRQVLFIGLAQAAALMPGTSRSGITIIAGLAAGLKREEAVKFSFLLSIPLIFGAAAKELPILFSGAEFSGYDLRLIAVAFVCAFASAFFAIKYFLKFAQNHRLDVFAYYRFLLALIVLLTIVF